MSEDQEVTPAMIDAGVQVYLDYCSNTGVGDRIDREMVTAIFEAMNAKCSIRRGHLANVVSLSPRSPNAVG